MCKTCAKSEVGPVFVQKVCKFLSLKRRITFLSAHRKGRGSVKASASGNGVHEGLPSGAGLGRREARRRGLGTAQSPTTKKRLNRCQSSRVGGSGFNG